MNEKEFVKLKKELLLEYKDIFSIYEELNYYLREIEKKIKKIAKYYKPQEMTIVALLLKSIRTFESIYLLFRNCFYNDAFILLRVLFEEMIRIQYCCKGEKECDKYRLRERNDEIEKIKKALKIPESPVLLNILNVKSLDKIKEKLTERREEYEEYKDRLKKSYDKEELKVKKIAEETDNSELYSYFYSLTSDELHSLPPSLGKYYSHGDNGKINGFLPRTKMEKCDITIILTAMDFILSSWKPILKLFNISEDEKISKLTKKINKMTEKYYNK